MPRAKDRALQLLLLLPLESPPPPSHGERVNASCAVEYAPLMWRHATSSIACCLRNCCVLMHYIALHCDDGCVLLLFLQLPALCVFVVWRIWNGRSWENGLERGSHTIDTPALFYFCLKVFVASFSDLLFLHSFSFHIHCTSCFYYSCCFDIIFFTSEFFALFSAILICFCFFVLFSIIIFRYVREEIGVCLNKAKITLLLRCDYEERSA